MILTGREIAKAVACGDINISPASNAFEPNSYGFRLGDELLMLEEHVLQPQTRPRYSRVQMGDAGFILEPRKLYLGRTFEAIGSARYAMTLYARRSVSTMGLWIQVSAPLGHTGPAIPWTLELRAAHRLRVYPQMLIGKIAFWRTHGVRHQYKGKYHSSRSVVASLLATEICAEHGDGQDR